MATAVPPRMDLRTPLRRTASDGPTAGTSAPLPSSIFPAEVFYSSQSSPFQIQNDDADGEILAARYQMLEELGSGSFGVVYKAIERSTGAIVAVKHVDLESSEEDLSDILSELSVLSSCSSPYVTQYKSAFLRKQTLWIVMEYLGGGSCADLLKPPPHRLTEAHIAIVCRELLLGLSYLHREGKLHRDVKAANILLGMDGRVKLADFGVAAQLTGLKSIRNTFVGTPFWMAPEVIQQEGHDAKADVWSLGITAVELAMGQPPHANVHPMKVLFLIPKQPAPRLDERRWSRDFCDFVRLCLQKNVDQRPTAKQLLKHRFVRGAGRVEGLQELIQAKQDWETGRGEERHLKYYAETLRPIKTVQVDENDDEWVFETVRASALPNRGADAQTTRKGRSERTSDISMLEETTNVLEDMSYVHGTTRRVSGPVEANSSVRRAGTKKWMSQARRPLGVNMSFGNSPSTVRQFRRSSGKTGDTENKDPGSPIHSPQNLACEDDGDCEAGLANLTSMSLDQPPAQLSMDSKEAHLGRRLYSLAIGNSCQDVLNSTASQPRREAISRLAEAFSDLEAADPEGLYHVMRSITEKMQADSQLRRFVPTSSASSPSHSRQVSSATILEEIETGTVQRSPTKSSRIQAASNDHSRCNSPARLVLAQNNPHLKSHRRRQSAQVAQSATSSRDSSRVWGSPSKDRSHVSSTTQWKDKEEAELDQLIQKSAGGSGGPEHTKIMAEVMFERWCEGLRVRWPAVS